MTEISDLRIICGHCRAVFPGPGGLRDIESLEGAIRDGLELTCPSCGQVLHCSSKNTMWRNADGSPGGASR
jgi:hypothetical protein